MLKHILFSISMLTLVSCATKAPLEEPTTGTSNSKTAGKPEQQLSSDDFHQQRKISILPQSPLNRNIDPNDLAQIPDLWQRAISQMQLKFSVDNNTRREINFFSTKQSFFNEISRRAEPFLYHIVLELERRGMPLELALIPMVESSFNPLAQNGSPAGIWQMVPQTARNFGLKITPWYDGRKDPIASTHAVLDYLQYLHDNLDQDWLNAVAAYNTGESRIQSAILRNKAKGKATDFYSLQIPSKYVKTVPKWLAMVSILKNVDQYAVKPPPIENKSLTETTPIKASIDLRQAATVAGISHAELKQLNPGFRKNTTPPERGVLLLLPRSNIEQFERAHPKLLSISPQAQTNTTASTSSSRTKSSGSVYTVRKGDSLWTISRELGVDAEQLRKTNGLSKNATLALGQQLKIPSKDKGAVQSNTPSDRKKTVMHQVRAGDSLDKIARKYKVKVKDLLRLNSLKADSILKLGQQLRVR